MVKQLYYLGNITAEDITRSVEFNRRIAFSKQVFIGRKCLLANKYINIEGKERFCKIIGAEHIVLCKWKLGTGKTEEDLSRISIMWHAGKWQDLVGLTGKQI